MKKTEIMVIEMRWADSIFIDLIHCVSLENKYTKYIENQMETFL
jgi:hypothetical protein